MRRMTFAVPQNVYDAIEQALEADMQVEGYESREEALAAWAADRLEEANRWRAQQKCRSYALRHEN